MYHFKYIFLVLLFLSFFVSAQQTSGSVKYLASPNYDDFKEKSEEIKKDKPNLSEKVNMMVRNTRDVYYVLSFNKNHSFFEQDKDLDNDGERGIINMTSILGGKSVYREKEKKALLKSSFANIWIDINDEDAFVWKLTSESKLIQNYKCLKAESSITITNSSGKMKTFPIIAWYAPEIPVNYGPGKFNGLPGLILELKDWRDFYFKAVEVNISQKEMKIKPPVGKVINRQEYEILTKKMKEKMKNSN